ncbi:hypothetical protein [Paenibacillus gansuensis]|uniref:Group-specific protein n=1 Tax=Paenibacillus gansuensis TaxID=306542 RepID=A0ABW5PB06_9BACL
MQIDLTEKQLHTSLGQFIFPFSIIRGSRKALVSRLHEDGFQPFYLNDIKLEDAFYGEGYKVSHERMERYYLPFTSSILFPHQPDPESFMRYSIRTELDCTLQTAFHNIPFRIHSLDAFICPFDIGFITVRTEMTGEELDFTTALEFANRFRVLQDKTSQDIKTAILHEGNAYQEVEEFIFHRLAAGILPFLDKDGMEGAYFETLPYFMDERMFVSCFFGFSESTGFSQSDLYRASRLNGVGDDGKPFISASNPRYIDEYVRKHGYDRWDPDTYYMMNEHTFSCLTNQTGEEARFLANQMYGEYYYSLLLNMFHKIVLLKLSNRYSQVRMAKDQHAIEELIRNITKFSSKYFFLELVSQSQGREIFIKMRSLFANQELYEDVKETLTDLFKYQETFASRNRNYLLTILTVYTVISGIYGMNQVIEDLKAPVQWNKMAEYSVFEYIALFLAFSGIVVGFVLGITVLVGWVREQVRNRKE